MVNNQAGHTPIDNTFLPELEGDTSGVLFHQIYKGDPICRIIYETQNFAVLSDIAPLISGHLLIIPKRPWISFGNIPIDNWDELIEIKIRVTRNLGEIYSHPIFVEHGSCSSTMSGGCITHAHLHAVPGPIEFIPRFTEHNLDYKQIFDIKELIRFGSRDIPYIYFEDINGKMYVVELKTPIRKQFVRIGIAEFLGLEDPLWDWGVHINKNLLRQTVKDLKEASWQNY